MSLFEDVSTLFAAAITDGQDNEAIVKAAYEDLLGYADADTMNNSAARIDYWVQKLSSGELTTDNFGGSFLEEANTNQGSLISSTTFENNQTVVAAHEDAYEANPDVTLEDLTAVAAENRVEDVAEEDEGVTGETFTLTTSIDSPTGTADDDTFIGDNNTTTAADSVDGGAGTDTLRIVGTNTLPSISNIESLTLENTNATATVDRDLSSTDLSSVTTLTLDGFEAADGGTTYTIKAGDVVNLVDGLDAADGNDDDLDITAAKAVKAATVGVNNSGTSATADMELDFIGAGITDVTLNSTGQKSFVDVESSAGGTLKSLTINATTDVAISDIDQATTITAAGSTGDVTLDTAVNKVSVTGGDGADTVTLDHAASVAFEGSVELGAGDDSLVLTSLNGAADLVDDKVTLDGGEGTDSLTTVSDLAISLSALSEENLAKKGLSSFEKIVISNATENNDVIDFDRAGISDIDFAAALVDTNSFTVSDGSTMELSAAADASADTATVTVKDAAAAGSDDDEYSLKLNAANGAGGNNNIDYGVHKVAAVETINIESTATDSEDVTTGDNEVDLVAANAGNINVTGDVALDLSNDAFDGVVETFDASDFTGATLKASFAGGSFGVTATTGETAATLTGSSNADLITTGGKGDTITGADGIDVITTGAGSDTVNMNEILGAANRDVIRDFDVDNDDIEIGADETSDATSSGNAAVVTGIGSKSTTHSLADSDLIEFSFDVGDSGDLSAATDGTELIKGLSDTAGTSATLSVDADEDQLYLIAYDAGDAFLYHANDRADGSDDGSNGSAALEAEEITLVGTLEDVEAGSLSASNFNLVA